MVRVRASKCGPHNEIGQQEGVCGDYRTVAGRVRGKAFFAPSASRGKTPARTASRFLLTSVLVEIQLPTDVRSHQFCSDSEVTHEQPESNGQSFLS